MKQNQVNFTVTAAEKKQIEKLAEACGLSQGEYLRQRALGFEPRAFPPGEGYWRLHSDLLWLMNHALSPEYEARYETEGKGKHRTQRVVIYYRFVGYIDLSEADFEDALLQQENHRAETRQGVAVEYLPEKPNPEHRPADAIA